MKMQKITSDRLSWYRTEHDFLNIADIETMSDLVDAEQYATDQCLKIFVIGNGSNVFFNHRKIRSVILRPQFEEEIIQEEDVFNISGNTNVSKLLPTLRKQSRDGPYYLASVPATIGGAVAMNAGTGHADANFISDFLIDVTVWRNGEVKVFKKEELDIEFRKTNFSEAYFGVIRYAKFKFPVTTLQDDPIKARKKWAREFQNATVPNCGSTFRHFNGKLMRVARRLTSVFPAYFCQKSSIWISNTSKRHIWIKLLISTTKLLHKLTGQRCELEIREVD